MEFSIRTGVLRVGPCAAGAIETIGLIHAAYAPELALPMVLRNVRLALAKAESAAVPMPSVSVVPDRLSTGSARGYAGIKGDLS
jgi:hypothetical protein